MPKTVQTPLLDFSEKETQRIIDQSGIRQKLLQRNDPVHEENLDLFLDIVGYSVLLISYYTGKPLGLVLVL